MRIWERVRKPIVAQWRTSVERSYNWAAKGRSPEAAVWRQALKAEAAAARGLESAASLGADDDLWVLDGGTLPESPPSTIVDCSEPTPVVVRQGTIPLARVRCVLPEIQAAAFQRVVEFTSPV